MSFEQKICLGLRGGVKTYSVQKIMTDLLDEIMGSVRHEDTITPGRTAGVHVLRWFSVVFTVRVAMYETRKQT